MSSPTIQTMLLVSFLLIFLVNFLADACDPYDQEVLLRFKNQLSPPSSTLSSTWIPGRDCCKRNSVNDSWAGVGCNQQGRVNDLELSSFGQNLSGHIPPVFGELPFLESFVISGTELIGTIPFTAICNLTNLRLLFIDGTNMSGQIPECLGKLKKLTFISFSNNPLMSGSIPKALGALPNLEILSLSFCNLVGHIPSELSQLPKLAYLDLVGNKLDGSIPASLGLAPKLTSLVLSNNRLKHKIPETFGSIQNIFLADNQLSGSIPMSIGQFAELIQIDVSNNNLHGDPSFLLSRRSPRLSLVLSNNSFKFDFSNVNISDNLENLVMSHNQVYGSIPARLNEIPFNFINVTYNKLCGQIPPGRLSTLSPAVFANNKCLCGAPLPPCN